MSHIYQRTTVFAVLAAVILTLALVAVATPTAEAQSDKPRIAVLQFENKAESTWWYNRGGEAAQDMFITELVKTGKFRVIDRERLADMMRERDLAASGDLDPSTAVRIGKMLGVEYFLTGAVTEYGATDTSAGAGGLFQAGKTTFVAAMNARIIDAETGEIVWADEARGEDGNFRLRIRGIGGGVDSDERMFDKVAKPVIEELAASIRAADL